MTVPGQIDAPLAVLLRSFARRNAEADDPHEGVSVTVDRIARFSHAARTPHGIAFALDEPEAFGGTGEAADPAEQLLAAAAASLSVTLTAHAALHGVAIDGVRVAAYGRIDGRSFFDPRVHKRAGLLDVTLALTVTTQASKARMRALLADALLASPVLRSLRRRPRVTLDIKTSEG